MLHPWSRWILSGSQHTQMAPDVQARAAPCGVTLCSRSLPQQGGPAEAWPQSCGLNPTP